MNLRQAQRSLAELVSKCEAAHIQLPEDPLEARAEAVEAIIHSLTDGKVNLADALDELQQKYGLELAWKQHLENEEAKRQRRRQSRQKKTVDRTKDPRRSSLAISIVTKEGVMTPSKRPSTGQEQQNAPMKVAKKVKSARALIINPQTVSESEEKQPPPEKIPAAGQGNILADDGSRDRGVGEMLALEDLDELEEEGSAMSSDEEFVM
ncbi:uncharacterized protein PITG_00259 [Phytophthora infestans T30-4]|uniref:Uncharacterized protein n=1 Tax=Phytophthora infestans (strain T30-4) TaxID=403677 RepID=D0MQC5_PHYIT|nr:uncharacterized protein PITG_00259 [Phytophthora infestans T30-4]EEY57694.1 conserved hypothetical protein [Phytophthora infestans T30-4]|eukprot:XP_002908880.1 conserved hypothetical protein [Phytophthora infestans T30-4]